MKNIGYVKLAYNHYGFVIDCHSGKEFFFYKLNVDPDLNMKSLSYGKFVSFEIFFNQEKDKNEGKNIELIKPTQDEISKFEFKPNKEEAYQRKKKKRKVKADDYIVAEQLLKNPDREAGYVISFHQTNGFGMIKDENGINRKFSIKKIKDQIIPKPGNFVSFIPKEVNNVYSANNVRIIKKELSSLTDNKANLFRGIKKWAVDARLEPVNWFYHFDGLEDIKSGDKLFVIGRKGTGKTAVSQYISKIDAYDVFVDELDFKAFPFTDLYEFSINTLGFQSQHRNLWKFIIYLSIVKMMSKNENINSEALEVLKNVFPHEYYSSTISSKLNKYNLSEINFKLLYGLVAVKLKKATKEFKDWSLLDKIEILETIIIDYIDDSKYFILFDDLDEDYSNIKFHHEYFDLLKGLFKSALDIKYKFNNKKNIHPVVFLRSDIYNNKLLIDDNKNRWDDLKYDLIWSKQKIKELIAHRLSKISNPNAKPIEIDFESQFSELFEDKYVRTIFGNKEIFDFISEITYQRPRDYIVFLKLICIRALSLKSDELSKMLISTSKSFSNALRTDISGELYSILPIINDVLNIISHIRKNAFYFEEFGDKYDDEFSGYHIGALKCMRILFDNSIVGNITHDNVRIFKFLSPYSTFNEDEPIIIHKGLLNSLQILR